MNALSAVIDSLNAKIAQLQDELDATLERAVKAETAWAEAINRARDAEDEVRRLEKEIEQEIDE